MTFEIGVGAFTICAVVLVFGLLTSTFKFPHRSGKAVESLVVDSNFTPSPTPTAAPSPTPGATVLPDTSEKNHPSSAPTRQPPAIVQPTGGSKPPSPTATPFVDKPPVVLVTATPASGSAPLTVRIDASQSWDTDGTRIANFVFYFGDGTSASPIGGATSVTHTYAVAGVYTVSVVATDTAGLSSTGYATVVAHPA